MLLALTGACDSCDKANTDTVSSAEPTLDVPAVPASRHPEGHDLKPGAIVIAEESEEAGGGVRIYKLKEIKWFPKPMGNVFVFIAYDPKGADFKEAARLWAKRELTVVLAHVEVARYRWLNNRNYRVIGYEAVSDVDKQLKPKDTIPPVTSPLLATPPGGDEEPTAPSSAAPSSAAPSSAAPAGTPR